MRQFKAKSPEREFINGYLKSAETGSDADFVELVKKICKNFPETGKSAKTELLKYRPQVILNQGQNSADLEMAKRLRSLIQKKLGINMDFVGFLPKDEQVSFSIALRKPLALANPGSGFVRGIETSAERIMIHSYRYNELNGFEADDISKDKDLKILDKEFTAALAEK